MQSAVNFEWRERLRLYRQRLDLTQREVARASDIGVSEYRQYESGAEPLVTVAIRISKVLQCRPENIWDC